MRPAVSFRRSRCFAWLCLALSPLLPISLAAAPTSVRGLRANGRIVRDVDGVAHVFASNRLDASFLLGYVHAQDRFFQMDYGRHRLAGRLAELTGRRALSSDKTFRALGLHRAAAETWLALPAATREWIQAYADGVNAGLAARSLPAEYRSLELTRASIEPWRPEDTVLASKGMHYELAFRLDDLDRSVALGRFQAEGEDGGFDGTALFFEDTNRFAPPDKTVSIPRAAGLKRLTSPGRSAPESVRAAMGAAVYDLLRETRKQIAAGPLAWSLTAEPTDRGSNWWAIAGGRTTTGATFLAADPHLALDNPAVLYEAHLTVESGDPGTAMNAYGVSFLGMPAFAQGCNGELCWGFTINPVDVTDLYAERLIVDGGSGLPTHTVFRGAQEPLEVITETYRINDTSNGTDDDLTTEALPPLAGGRSFVVPRRNRGSLIRLDASDPDSAFGVSVQYTGFRATFELEAYRLMMHARDLGELRDALDFLDTGSQNVVAADRLGHIAYWTTGELPVREDLQTLGHVDGAAPFLVRDGTGARANEWLPATQPPPRQALAFEVLAGNELPHVVDPLQGYVLNGNNDPAGATLDNDPLNERRENGGILYLGSHFSSLRSGRIARLLSAAFAGGAKVSLDQMKEFQANNQMLDAEMVVPYLATAFDHARRSGAPSALAGLGRDDAVEEAISRLKAWNWSSPTGIRQGYDPGDDPDALAAPGNKEIARSVAATIYSTLRGRLLARTIDAALDAHGLDGVEPDPGLAWAAVIHLLETFGAGHGIGASGLRLIPLAPGTSSPEDGRDWTLLQSLKDALDLLASDAFAPAFANSSNLGDYRWGYLHRIEIKHPLGDGWSIPERGGFEDVAPNLPGLARGGGFEVVDASPHNARAARPSRFQFGAGAAHRFVGALSSSGIEAYLIVAGGASEDPGSDLYADQLGRWLTHQYHPVRLSVAEVQAGRRSEQELVPAP